MDESSVRLRMQEVLNLLVSDVKSIRTGRVTPALVENLQVTVYSGQQKLKVQELATISATEAQTLIIDPWDKSILGEIRQGILATNVGLNPVVDQDIIRISLPPLTSEDREKYIKLLHAKLENGKIMIRQIRQEVMHGIKEAFEDKKLSEDEKFLQEKLLQEITDEFVGELDLVGKSKEQELHQI